jgi:hypothetical protein
MDDILRCGCGARRLVRWTKLGGVSGLMDRSVTENRPSLSHPDSGIKNLGQCQLTAAKLFDCINPSSSGTCSNCPFVTVHLGQ